ncbi:MAG: GTPase [Pseudomonadota bacterium]
MPTNVGPEYHSAELKFRQAKTREEKIACLEEMITVMPKHKGTDKLRSTLNQKLKKLKEGGDEKKGGKRQAVTVPKEGAAQVMLLGPPNSGKSQIINSLTKATPEIAAYPFTTRMPVPGMMPFEDVNIQLVEMPAITETAFEIWTPDIVRKADLALIIVDLASPDLLEILDPIVSKLQKHYIFLCKQIPETEERKVSAAYIRTLIFGNKIDHPEAKDNLEMFKEWLANRFEFIGQYCAQDPNSLQEFPKQLFEALQIIRVYTKAPGKKIEKKDPIILPVGSNTMEAAQSLHKEIAHKLKFARVWGEGMHDGQQIARDHVLQDGWALEFHL